MALCVKSGGVWRNVITVAINVSGTWRCPYRGGVKASGVWNSFFSPQPGATVGGGRVICNVAATCTLWIVAPSSSQVTRTWYCRGDSNLVAQQVTGVAGWFVPCETQYQNPGYVCRAYWDTYGTVSGYWSSTQVSGRVDLGCVFFMFTGGSSNAYKGDNQCVRSFRTVTY